MTAVIDEPETDAAAPPPPAEPPRRGARWARWRVDLRLARRQVLRAKGSSALVMLLVALPVAGMAGAAVFWQSHIPTAEQRVELELGRNAAWIAVVGGPDPSRAQSVDEPWNTTYDTDPQTGVPTHPQLPPPESPNSFVPGSASMIELGEYGSAFVDTAAGVGRTAVTTGPAWDPVFTGRYAIIDGAAPTTANQAMVSPGLLQRLGARIGGTVTLTDSGTPFTITGTMRELDQRPQDDMLFLPASAASDVTPGTPRWFVADWQPSVDGLRAMNRAGFIVFARDLVLGPPAGSTASSAGSDADARQLLMLGSIIAVFSGYLVVLLAGAAFAVAARRQQRSLAVAGSVGASRSDVLRVVVLQGTVLGFAGGIAGAAVGIGGAALLLALLDDGARGSFRTGWGLQIPWGLLAGLLLFAVIVGTLSALAPARAATRGDVLGALRGARRPAALNAKRPLWGLGLMILGLGVTVAGAAVTVVLNAAEAVDYGSPVRQFSLYGIVFGPVLFQIGIIIAGHWTLTRVSRAISRLGVAPRLAGRDAAANPSRVVPAFAAIAACVFIASFALSMTALVSSASNRTYSWSGPKDALAVTMWTPDVADAATALRGARDLVDPTSPTATALLSTPADAPSDPTTGALTDPDFPVWTVASHNSGPTDCAGCDPRANLAVGAIAIVEPGDLEMLLGQRVPASVQSAFRSGSVLSVASWMSGGFDESGKAQIAEWTSAGLAAFTEATQEYQSGTIGADALPAPARLHELPAIRFDLARPQSQLQAIISVDTARSLGMQIVPRTLYASYAQPPSQELVDKLTAAAQNVRIGDAGGLYVAVERGPGPVSPWLWLISAIAVVLVIGAGAVCLGLARFERRPDDATLTAVGAGRGLRRRINAWQAAILVGIGTVTGTVAGLIPVWGLAAGSSGYLRFADTPWPWLGILALGLPLVMTIAAWLVPPRHPDLTRRTAIA